MRLIDSETSLGQIIHAALDKRGLSALEAMLRALSGSCGGFGAALWQVRIEGQRDENGISEDFKPAKVSDLSTLPPDRTRSAGPLRDRASVSLS